MDIKNIPNLSAKFKNVYKKYIDHGADPEYGLYVVDRFLQRYPFYSEALIFKARMLIALSRNREAMQHLKAAQRIDEWKVIALFDEAEILHKWNKKEEAFRSLLRAVKLLTEEATDGIDTYLNSIAKFQISVKNRESIRKYLIKIMIDMVRGKSYVLDFRGMINLLNDISARRNA